MARSSPPLPALEQRDRTVAELKASGPDHRGLAEPAAVVAAAWTTKVVKAGGDIAFGPFECHAKGCFATAVHRSEQDVEKAMQVITRTAEFHGWQSGKMRSGLITRTDGKLETTWVLYPPPPGQPAMAATLPEDNVAELEMIAGR